MRLSVPDLILMSHRTVSETNVDCLLVLVEKGLSKNTIAAYSADLSRYLDFLKTQGVVDMTSSDTALVLKHLIVLRDRGLGPRSRSRHLVAIRGFYRFLVQEKVLGNNPAKIKSCDS
jgi:integrase/recombinase XerD